MREREREREFNNWKIKKTYICEVKSSRFNSTVLQCLTDEEGRKKTTEEKRLAKEGRKEELAYEN
jgi:endo-alpha-1,4-polygalactosaminidase (GH114 family)